MKIKSVIGVILIVLSVLGMYLWETRFREKIIFTDVLAAAVDISEGDVAGRDSFRKISVSSDSLINGYMTPEGAEELYGKTCIFPLKAGSVVFFGAFEYVSDPEPDGMHTVFLPSSWIFDGSSELFSGDTVLIYYLPRKAYLGSYEVREVSGGRVGIRCDLDSYFAILSELQRGKEGSLFLVSEK